MPRNIEIKAKVAHMEALAKRALELATEPPLLLSQEDIFFVVPSGRLKLRIFSESQGELIQYDRPDVTEAKESRYLLYRTESPRILYEVLAASLPELVTVIKERRLIMAGRTRIHLDQVEGLGDFMELEVVLEEGEASAAGDAEAKALMEKLGISQGDCIAVAYADMLLANGAAPGA